MNIIIGIILGVGAMYLFPEFFGTVQECIATKLQTTPLVIERND